MKHKAFFYLQYNKLNWEAQEKTKINSFVNNFIINNIIAKHRGPNIRIFDIGFGIGFFLKILYQNIKKDYKNIIIEGCEPSHKNFEYFKSHPLDIRAKDKLMMHKDTFQDVRCSKKFDFITAIYVFPHFESDDLKRVIKKIHSMLYKEGKFILVVADEKYLEKKLKAQKDLFIEKNIITFKGKKYNEVLHYSELPKIGTVIDYNRESRYYIDLFKKNNFKLLQKKNLDDNGFICTIFVFEAK